MNYKSIIRLKLLGFNETDKSRFEAILSLAETRLDRPWQIVSEPTADFYLLSARLMTQLDHDKLLQSLPRDRCIFYTTGDISHNRYELRIDSNCIPRCSALINLFNELSAGIENDRITAIPQQPLSTQQTTPIPVSNPPPEDSGENLFDPGHGLLAILLPVRHTPQIISLTEQIDYPAIYLDVSNNYYCAVGLGQMEAYFSSSAKLSIRAITAIQLQDLVAAAKLNPQPLKSLIWYAAFKSSHGRMLKGYAKEQAVQLKRWPDMSLPGCRQLLHLAAFMQSNRTDLETIAEQTQTPLEQVYDFYNACEIIGLIIKGDRAEIHAKQLNTEQRSLLAKIGKRLGQTPPQT